MDQTQKRSIGPIIGIAVIVVLIILGALYFWGGKLTASNASASAQTTSVAPVSPSDDIASIKSDLQATDTGPDLSNLQ